MGRLLDANVNSVKRRDERIVLVSENIRRLKILPKDISVFIQNVPRPCVLREFSFASAKIVIRGVAKFLMEKDSALRIDFEDPRESFLIRGKLTAVEPVEGRQDLLVVDIEFVWQLVPLGYKMRLNDFLCQIWADTRSNDRQNAVNGAKKTVPTAPPPAVLPKSPANADTPDAGTEAARPPATEKTLGEAVPQTAQTAAAE
jgi:hypothetical protein